MRHILIIIIKIILFLITIYLSFDIILEFKLKSRQNKYNQYNLQNIPAVFKFNPLLWRPGSQSDIKEEGDRILIQWNWISNLSSSNYINHPSFKKKRLLLTGLFNLDDEEKAIPCHQSGLNLSNYCELVEDLWYNPMFKNYDDFDAVLSRRDWNNQFYEPKVPPSKTTFFHIQESPYTLHQGDFRVNNPILASYWRGSDIVTPYYKWMPYPSNNSTELINPKFKNYAEGKTKLGAMVASHCPTANDRLGFVQELQKYIPVDVYGTCGPLKAKCEAGCFKMIEEQYKFYFAFENANCRDYITEKFFRNGLGYDILPVVLGAHPDDYRAAAPPNSYIHVDEFNSPKDLADYLIVLDQNDTLYSSYFEWKGKGEIIHGQKDLFCRICGMLFYADFHPPPQWPIDAFSWLQVNPCLDPNQFHWLLRNGSNYEENKV